MNRKWDRRNVGLWFIGILSVILAAIGLWFARYTDWWIKWIGSPGENLQTINTGASVFVSSTSSPPEGSPKNPTGETPGTPPSPPTGTNPPQRPQMW
jgi:hypothetical protein